MNALEVPSAASVCIGQPVLTTLPLRYRNELPIDRSHSVLTGEVLTGQPFLSASKSVVYTEFEVRVIDVVKGAPGSKEVITVLRRGGRVSREDGTVAEEADRARYSFEAGKEYLLFLVYDQPSQASCIETIFRIEEERLKSAWPVEQDEANASESKVEGRPVSEVLRELKEESKPGARPFRMKRFP